MAESTDEQDKTETPTRQPTAAEKARIDYLWNRGYDK